jgi:hypothetical protein
VRYPLRRTFVTVAVACVLSAGLGGIAVSPANAAGITSTVTGFNNPQGVAVLPDGSAVYVVTVVTPAIFGNYPNAAFVRWRAREIV